MPKESQAIAYLGIDLHQKSLTIAVLVENDEKMREVVTIENKIKVIDRYLIDHLLPNLEGKRWPTVFEIPGIEGAENTPEHGYQTLLSPLLDRHGNLEGVLAQLGRVNGEDFHQREVVRHFASFL